MKSPKELFYSLPRLLFPVVVVWVPIYYLIKLIKFLIQRPGKRDVKANFHNRYMGGD